MDVATDLLKPQMYSYILPAMASTLLFHALDQLLSQNCYWFRKPERLEVRKTSDLLNSWCNFPIGKAVGKWRNTKNSVSDRTVDLRN
jgi:hypothetical protein